MSAPAGLLSIVNDAGRVFNVRIVRAGDRYGLDDCLVHKGLPVIEFYDDTYHDGFGQRGQFVARYYAHTLLERAESNRTSAGLMLAGRVREWVVSAANVREALDYFTRVMARTVS